MVLEHTGSVDRQHGAASGIRGNTWGEYPGHAISEPALSGKSLRPDKWDNDEHDSERRATRSLRRLFTYRPKLLDRSRALNVQRPPNHADEEDGTWFAATSLVHIRKGSDRRDRQRNFSEWRQPAERQSQFRAGLGPG